RHHSDPGRADEPKMTQSASKASYDLSPQQAVCNLSAPNTIPQASPHPGDSGMCFAPKLARAPCKLAGVNPFKPVASIGPYYRREETLALQWSASAFSRLPLAT